MNKIFNTTATVLLMLIFCMCKKNTTTNSNNNNPNTDTTAHYGELQIVGQQYIVGSTIYSLSVLGWNVFFTSSPIYLKNFQTTPMQQPIYQASNAFPVFGGTVSLNNIPYVFNSNPIGYHDTASSNNNVNPPYTWAVTGSGSIPSFTYTNTNNMPSYTGYALLPDTIYKSQQNTLQITGINGADEITIGIDDGGTNDVVHSLHIGVNSVSFSSSELSALVSGQGFIGVFCLKNNMQMFGGKRFCFPIFYQATKQVYIK
ncbi:MAG: hypothetical protein JST67_07875 [Bacteroidetes bacterium]|nr:hypothetical protein [Bacteroidota bacterium]